MHAHPHDRAQGAVLIFATGGTIGMRETPQGLDLDPEFPDALEVLARDICAPLGIDWRISHLQPPIESANADAETAPKIARAIRARVRTQGARGVVVTHGTDTLAYTAARLAFELGDLGCPVVLTGSMLPLGAAGTDVPANLSLAVRTAVAASAQAPVSIAFAGRILPAVRSRKYSSDALDGFRAELPIGPRSHAATFTGPHPGTLSRLPPALADSPANPARIVSFRFVPGTAAEDLRAAVAAHPAGIVLECYGAGNAPMSKPGMAQAIRDACQTLPVLAITQCDTGGVNLSRYAVGQQLRKAGVIDGGDLTIEAAVAKLGFLVDRGYRGDELRELIETNLVGERANSERYAHRCSRSCTPRSG